jgi:hypothetical protein
MTVHYETLCGKWIDDSKSYDDRQIETPEHDDYNNAHTTDDYQDYGSFAPRYGKGSVFAK